MPETGITSNPWDVDTRPAQISPIGTVNGASDWNGGGRLFDARVGFGALDTEAAVRLAAAWTPGGTQADLVTRTVDATPNSAIPDGGGPLVIPLALEPDVAVEHVQLALEITHGWIGDLTVTLVSPHGTRSVLLDRPGKAPGSDGHGSSADDLDFTLTSNAFRGEDAGGVWELEVRDAASGFAGRLEAASLEVAGTPDTGDDVYIFTDVYASLAAFDPGRGQLSDASGDDHLQAAALSDDAVIDLEPGATSRLADQPLELRAGTEIEDATGGSGNDRILGNGADNTLVGGPGADVLYGRSGADVLDGGPGDDRLHGGPGADTFVVSAGTDTVVDFTPWAGDRLVSGEATAGPTDEGSLGVQVSRTADGVELRLDDGARVRLAGIDTFDADWFAA
jgi:subtilisin-like proprotein convertase family protein